MKVPMIKATGIYTTKEGIPIEYKYKYPDLKPQLDEILRLAQRMVKVDASNMERERAKARYNNRLDA